MDDILKKKRAKWEDDKRRAIENVEKLERSRLKFENVRTSCADETREWTGRKKEEAEKREVLLRAKESLAPQLEKLQMSVDSKLKLVERNSAAVGEELEYTDRAHRRLTELLGMRVIPKKYGNSEACCVQVEFTNIDAKHPHRKFVVMLKTFFDTKAVIVTDTVPKIPHGLHRAVQKLNDSIPRDFHSFWIWIRNEFIKLSQL